MVSDRNTAQPTRARYLIAGMLFVSVVINYLDRANLSVAAPQLARDLGFDDAQKGYILAAFGWTYAALQVPGGWLVDKIPPRILYPVAIALWSLATIGLGFVGSVAGLIGLRLLVGALEAPSYPINSRVVTTWFPERERATAVGFYTSGQFVGLAFLSPVLYALQQAFGWQMVFLVTGGVGVLWAAVWYACYREPTECRAANAAEIALIREGGGFVDLAATQKTRPGFRWSDLATVVSHRKLWGLYLGQFCLTSTLWFFLTWFPTYLVDFRGMDFIKAGILGSVPFLAAFAGVNCSGILSDRLVRAGWSLGMARKLPIITGLLISSSIIGANYVESPALVILFLSLAFFGNGLASITWSLVSAIAPERLLGLTGGMFNFVGNLASVSVPIVIGYLVKGGDFAPAITYIAVTAIAGAVCYGLVVGKVERIAA
ncbi:MAG: MFS transporter [Planctomycetia bacterium]|nr:MFS transporter [Planctomycetia bacterium]